MNAGAPTGHRRLGRPRDPAADEAIISAVFDVIAEAGFAGFSVEAVAVRAGVGKATIYRRWPSREDLLVAAAEQVMANGVCPDTGTLRNDLVVWIWERHRKKHESPGPRLLGQIVAEARSNPELKRLLRRFHAARRDAVVEMVGRAEDRGEIGQIDGELLLDMISGTLLQRSLFDDRWFRRSEVEVVVDAALRGVGAGVRTGEIA